MTPAELRWRNGPWRAWSKISHMGIATAIRIKFLSSTILLLKMSQCLGYLPKNTILEFWETISPPQTKRSRKVWSRQSTKKTDIFTATEFLSRHFFYLKTHIQFVALRGGFPWCVTIIRKPPPARQLRNSWLRHFLWSIKWDRARHGFQQGFSTEATTCWSDERSQAEKWGSTWHETTEDQQNLVFLFSKLWIVWGEFAHIRILKGVRCICRINSHSWWELRLGNFGRALYHKDFQSLKIWQEGKTNPGRSSGLTDWAMDSTSWTMTVRLC